MSQESVKVIIEVSGGCVTNVIAGTFVHVEVIDWDNLKAEGICCPACFGTDLEVDESDGHEFTCHVCGAGFFWHRCEGCGKYWAVTCAEDEFCQTCFAEHERNLAAMDTPEEATL